MPETISTARDGSAALAGPPTRAGWLDAAQTWIADLPDDGTLDAVTPAVPADGGWSDAALAGKAPFTRAGHCEAEVVAPNSHAELRARYRALSTGSTVREKAAYERGREHQETLHKIHTDGAAEIAKIVASRRLSFSNPPQVAGEGFIYVIEFSTGTVKVGQTIDPKQRLSTHQTEAAVFGVGIARYVISPAHRNFKENESALIGFCRGVSRRARREYYHEVGFEAVVEFAFELDFRSVISNQIVIRFPAP